jgi:oxygen-independent coproporphyrinogen-3 oxidase
MAAADDSMLGVYVSVPFCRAKCSFCNFASGVGTAASIEAYIERLCAEIAASGTRASALQAELPRRVDTVYFGGGTPSLLLPSQLKRIFASLRGQFEMASDAEITLEAAPGQISDVLLDEAQRLGVNRVSLGVQSFVDREAASVGRLHNEQECVAEILRLRSAGVAEVGGDLIAGLPYQTGESWEHSLDVTAALSREGALTHLSVYMLEIDEDSRLGQEVLAGGQRFHAHGVPQDEIAAQLYERACERLPLDGFAQYEISNFAARQHRSRHNMKYWQREPYMGFGLDAHSMLRSAAGASRFANADVLETYMLPGSKASPLRMLPREDSLVRIGTAEAFEETVFLGLRMVDGIDPVALREMFPAELTGPCEEAVRELTGEGLMSNASGQWRLTLRGRLISNDVFGRLLEGVAA